MPRHCIGRKLLAPHIPLHPKQQKQQISTARLPPGNRGFGRRAQSLRHLPGCRVQIFLTPLAIRRKQPLLRLRLPLFPCFKPARQRFVPENKRAKVFFFERPARNGSHIQRSASLYSSCIAEKSINFPKVPIRVMGQIFQVVQAVHWPATLQMLVDQLRKPDSQHRRVHRIFAIVRHFPSFVLSRAPCARPCHYSLRLPAPADLPSPCGKLSALARLASVEAPPFLSAHSSI